MSDAVVKTKPDAAPAEERYGVGLFNQMGRIGGEVVTFHGFQPDPQAGAEAGPPGLVHDDGRLGERVGPDRSRSIDT